MEKMKTVDAGYVQCITTMRGAFNDCFTADITLVDLSSPDDLHDLTNERCYLVKKSELDAYMARKENLELKNCTAPVWDEYDRLTAKVKALEAENAYLTRINEDFFKERSKLVEENEALVERNTKLKCMVDKFYGMTSVGEELRAANEKLASEVDGLNKHISHLKVILEHDENRMAALITENNKLRGENVKLRLDLKLIRDSIDAADEEIERLKGDNSAKAKAIIRAEYRGNAWMDEHEKLIRKYHELEQTHDKKWSAMTEALKDKGVEVIYMGEQDGKPIIDIKVPGWDELKKEYGRVVGEFALCRKQAEEDHKKLEELKSRTLDNVEIRLSCGDIVWTYCDGFVHVSSGIDCIISADQITTGTIPKCKSCVHYMHNPSRYTHDWCYRPVPKEGGAGYIRKLNKEEVEGPACGDFKARKE